MMTKTLATMFAATMLGVVGYTYTPVCFSPLKFRTKEVVILSALQEAALHSRIEAPFANEAAASDFLGANPDCCRILDRDDPFYATEAIDRVFGRQTRVVEVAMFSEELDRNYTLYLWVNRCARVIEYTGI